MPPAVADDDASASESDSSFPTKVQQWGQGALPVVSASDKAADFDSGKPAIFDSMCHTSANSSAGEAPDWNLHEGVTNSFSSKQFSAPIEESSLVHINGSAVDSLATPDNLSADQQPASDATHSQCGGLSSGAKHMQEFWCLELFAGSAGITAAMVAAGLTKSFGVEFSLRHDRKAKVLRLDMLKPQCQSMILRWTRSPGLALVWMTPPLGTSSGQGSCQDPRTQRCLGMPGTRKGCRP